LSPSSLVPWLVGLQKLPKKKKLSVIFDNNNNSIILNNEATVRESFIHIFGMADTSQNFWQFQEAINLCIIMQGSARQA
jgi:hypothetical protein